MNKKKSCLIGIVIFTVILIFLGVTLRPLFEKASYFNELDVCDNNLERLKNGIGEYAKSHNGKLPKSETWKADILPYIEDKSKTTFDCPFKKHSYALNDKVSEIELKKLGENDIITFESPMGVYNGAGKNVQNPRIHGWCIIGDMGVGIRQPAVVKEMLNKK